MSGSTQKGYPTMGSTLTGAGPSGRGRFTAAVVAIALFLGDGAFAWRAFDPLRVHVQAESQPSNTDPWAPFSEGWTELPAPPIVRGGAAMVWTGSELLLWGGYDEATQAA